MLQELSIKTAQIAPHQEEYPHAPTVPETDRYTNEKSLLLSSVAVMIGVCNSNIYNA